MKKHIKIFTISVAMLGSTFPVLSLANETDTQLKEQLEQAKIVILEAEKEAQEILRVAREEADAIRDSKETLDPLAVQNGKVAVEINSGTIVEILAAIMPPRWRVMIDVEDSEVAKRKFQFVSNRSREQALNDLLKPIGMTHHYFFDLKDNHGNNSPLIVVSYQ